MPHDAVMFTPGEIVHLRHLQHQTIAGVFPMHVVQHDAQGLLMYLSPEPQINHGTYFSLLRDIITTMPSAWPIIEGINNDILNGDHYKALKEVKKLIAYEKKLLETNGGADNAGGDDAKEQRSA